MPILLSILRVTVFLIAGMLVGCGSQGSTRDQIVKVRASGQGSTREVAIDRSFRNAVQTASGTVLSSQQQVEGGILVRDEILDYSSGFIVQYDIVNERILTNGQTQVEIIALVSSSKLANVLLNRITPRKNIGDQTNQIYSQLSSIVDERAKADALIDNILKEFPSRAFEIDVQPAVPRITDDRQTQIFFPVKIRWSQQFLEAFMETIRSISSKCYIVREYNDPECRYGVRYRANQFDIAKNYGFILADAKQRKLLVDSMSEDMKLILTFSNNSGKDTKFCFPVNLSGDGIPKSMKGVLRTDSYQQRVELINGEIIFSALINVPNIAVIKNINNVQASMNKRC
jgi:hypothetical protein